MANDKDFVVNGPVAVGKDTKVTVGSIAAGTVDLSTGNYFTDSPSGDYTYTFANAGDVQSFQIEATGGSEAVAETFSTTLYDGNGATQTIDNGLDLAGDGGLVWLKCRNQGSQGHFLMDSARNSFGDRISSHDTSAKATDPLITSVSTGGFTLGNKPYSNSIGDTYVSWSFKKQAKFFDVVTYTGNGVFGRSIPHNLGCEVGSIIVKRTDAAASWYVYHRGVDATAPQDYTLVLDLTLARINSSAPWADTAPTTTHFTVGDNSNYNASGGTYVAYLFAHDTASDGLIQCGSYTGNSSTDGPEINLGWQPQWVMIKDTTGSQGSWVVFDTARGIVTSDVDPVLQANLSNAEYTGTNYLDALSNGFKLTVGGGSYGTTQDTHVNYTGHTYIYMAIRSASAPAITWPTNIEWTAGSTPSTPAEGETDVYTFTTDDGGTTYTGIQSIDNAS